MFTLPNLWFAVGGVSIAAVAVLAIRWARRVPPDEAERRRRAALHARNRVIEGLVTDATEESVQYCYHLRGIEYFASQDVSAVRKFMPSRPEHWIGPVGVKFDPANPANSIVICEEWSGLRSTSKPQGDSKWKSTSA